MKKYLTIICCCLLLACQKGIHWDIASTGNLLKDESGNCLPVSVSGVYVADSGINSNNFITVDVNVTGIGTYNIYTDSIDGFVFKASGEFKNSGVNHVKLVCNGKPVAADTNYFTIHYDTSICEAVVIVKTNTVPPAKFSLQGAPGECLNNSVIGTYTKGVTLDSNNKINISVDVITQGRYTVTTDTVNGYSFTTSGVFESKGIQTIAIYPKGIPQKEGIDVFNVTSDSVSCSLQVKVNSDDAQFTLEGSPGECMKDSLTGTFVKGIGLDTFSKVEISVDVTLPGKYVVNTDVVNGYSFKGGGVFATTGVQTISLYADGTPVNAGTDVFSVTAGNSLCSFSVIVLPGVTSVTGDDLFPLTDSSYWVYDDLFNKGNLFKRSITGDSSTNGKVYKIMQQTDSYNISDQSLFRRDGNNYFEYAKEDKYTGSFQYAKSLYTELFFLKQNVAQNEYWESPEFKDEATFNQVIILKYDYKCLKSNGVVTVNGKAFANVWIIEMRPQIRTLTDPWGDTNEIYTYYYAKGVGLIYYKAISNFGYRKAEMQISSWLVK
ncbi:hypothetical protein FRZ67_05665 [Panacibacter ginsenosidivorans]|uniref:Uncharacterized protein n=1 Tax=Panacibacter ginsenosidivorans TaxID=1813871 RepID=A0A5B8V5Y8_9BACT|nr:hypothetical protein [Panacibacter ginsenosidivorans]QEC66814.1 hypothetical protein FRZ67_05665 [Panacibacter ginsenosidivorans]